MITNSNQVYFAKVLGREVQEGSAIRLDVNARSGGVKQHEKKVLGGWGATLGGRCL